jgi:dipeptidyl aminopeptidase/acylaminoacyl peptidase
LDTAVDVWHSNDRELLSERATAAKNPALHRRLIAQYDVSSGRLVRIGNATQYDVDPRFGRKAFTPDGRYALVPDRTRYTRESWAEERWDVSLVDAQTRNSNRIVVGGATDDGAGPEFSPTGRYMIWFDVGGWHAYELATQKTRDLTARLSRVQFARNTRDHRNLPRPSGFSIGGWTAGEAQLLVYDEFDVWALDPRGVAEARNVTGGFGRRHHLRLRLSPLDTLESQDGTIDPAQSLLLEATNLETRAEGWYRVSLIGTAQPTPVVMENVHFGALTRARHNEMYVTTKQTASMFPDLWIGPSLAALRRVTNINPQQADYHWAKADLVHWRSQDGTPLSGILYMPDDFDPTKQYPMVVTYYEKLSQTFHYYYGPNGDGRQLEINPTSYTSRGYLVFVPDIDFTIGKPGPSVLKSVLPGLQILVHRGFVKVDRIGCIGHSWGGYETFYAVTHSRLFAACAALAGVSNLPATYGTLYNNNWSAQRHAEHSQGRMKGSLWAYRDDYVANSPLFYLDRVVTPLLIVSNDHDDIVPPAEGFGVFMGLRRLGKPAYFLNYRGEGHQLERPSNIRDFDQRLLQFFDHYLRDATAPGWMTADQPHPAGAHEP